MKLEYLKLAFSSLTHRKVRSWLTMLGIFIGIAAIVSLIGLGEGLRTAITGQFGFLGTDVLSVQASGIGFAGPPGSGVVDPLQYDYIDSIKRISGVETAFARYIASGTVEFNNVQNIGFIGSLPEGNDRKIFEQMTSLDVISGRNLKDGDGKKIVVGYDFAQDATFGKEIFVGDKVLINDVAYEVVGILEKKGSFIFDGAILMNEQTMVDNLIDNSDDVNLIAVKVEDENKISKVQQEVEKVLRKKRDVKEGEENFQVESPQATLDQLNNTLFAVQLFVYIIASISLLVGGIGITNTMYTAVLERTKEIGIMKSIGAKNSTIFQLFFFESGLLGMVGGIIGIIIGLSGSYLLAFVAKLALGSDLIQVSISLTLILGALAFSFFVGTIAGVLPAYNASKQQPVESLRSVN